LQCPQEPQLSRLCVFSRFSKLPHRQLPMTHGPPICSSANGSPAKQTE
jgi:hypothetical protein